MTQALRERIGGEIAPELAPLVSAIAGEPGVVHLRNALTLADGFELEVIGCETPRVARALMLWLAIELPRRCGGDAAIERVTARRAPGSTGPIDERELTEQLLGVLAPDDGPADSGGTRRFLFIDATDTRSDERDAWGWFFQRFNERRNLVAARTGTPVTLLLSPELETALPRLAPDLWSIRSVAVAVRDVAHAVPSGRSADAVLPRDGSDGGDDKAIVALRAHVEELRADARKGRPHARRALAAALGQLVDLEVTRGEWDTAERLLVDEWLPLVRDLGDEAEIARTRFVLAGLLADRGKLDEALQVLQEILPTFERLGDARSQAITQGRIADILQARGELDEALRIRREDELPVYERLGDVRSKAITMGQIADSLQARGELNEALRIRRQEVLPVYERLGDVRAKAVTMGKIANILQARGERDEALRILRQEVLPVFERLGDVREKAMTMGYIADILKNQRELDDALRILRQDVLPVFEHLGAVREKAVTMGKIANILHDRGELDEALRIRRQDELPVFERLGDVREKAVAMGQIADILEAQGELDEALRIRRQDELPVYDRLGDERSKAVTMGKIAGILEARGELDEALRILREDQLPVFERLGGRDLVVGLGNLGFLLIQRGLPADLREARGHLARAEAMAAAMRLPFPDHLHRWLASSAGRS